MPWKRTVCLRCNEYVLNVYLSVSIQVDGNVWFHERIKILIVGINDVWNVSDAITPRLILPRTAVRVIASIVTPIVPTRRIGIMPDILEVPRNIYLAIVVCDIVMKEQIV